MIWNEDPENWPSRKLTLEEEKLILLLEADSQAAPVSSRPPSSSAAVSRPYNLLFPQGD